MSSLGVLIFLFLFFDIPFPPLGYLCITGNCLNALGHFSFSLNNRAVVLTMVMLSEEALLGVLSVGLGMEGGLVSVTFITTIPVAPLTWSI